MPSAAPLEDRLLNEEQFDDLVERGREALREGGDQIDDLVARVVARQPREESAETYVPGTEEGLPKWARMP